MLSISDEVNSGLYAFIISSSSAVEYIFAFPANIFTSLNDVFPLKSDTCKFLIALSV